MSEQEDADKVLEHMMENMERDIFAGLGLSGSELLATSPASYANATQESIMEAIRLLKSVPPPVFNEVYGNDVMLQQFQDCLAAGKEIVVDDSALASITGIRMIEDRYMPDGRLMLGLNGQVVGYVDLVNLTAYLWKGKRL